MDLKNGSWTDSSKRALMDATLGYSWKWEIFTGDVIQILRESTAISLKLYLPWNNAEHDLQVIVWNQTISTILPCRLPHVDHGRRPLKFLGTVARDVGLDVGYLTGFMLDHAVWRKILEEFSIVDRPK